MCSNPRSMMSLGFCWFYLHDCNMSKSVMGFYSSFFCVGEFGIRKGTNVICVATEWAVLVRVCLSQESDSKISLYFSEAKIGSLSLKLSEWKYSDWHRSFMVYPFETGKGTYVLSLNTKGYPLISTCEKWSNYFLDNQLFMSIIFSGLFISFIKIFTLLSPFYFNFIFC